MTRVGVISDTHGLLRPEALTFLLGSQMIIHCGDICGPEVLDELGRIAPVSAVRGNNDKGAWAQHIPASLELSIESSCVFVIHDLTQMQIDPPEAGIGVVQCGHSHKPVIGRRDDVLYVNPGSAGPRRFKLPISVAELWIDGAAVSPAIHTIALT